MSFLNRNNNSDTLDAASQALADFESGIYSTKRKAAEAYNVNERMLQHRLNGRKSMRDTHSKNHKLKKIEEDALCAWLKDRQLDVCRNPPRPIEVFEMAKKIQFAAGRDPLKVTKRWAKNFVNRKTGFSGDLCKGYVSEIFLQPEPDKVKNWYSHLSEVSNDIPPEQIFSLSVSGFQMGSIGDIDYNGDRIVITSESCDWLTIIDCLDASWGAMAPYIIFRGRKHSIHDLHPHVPLSWVMDSCVNSWSKSDILVKWLQDHFAPLVSSKFTVKHSILILDQSRHIVNDEFLRICEEKNIHVISTIKNFPNHMYFLDISLAGPLEEFYRKYIQINTTLQRREDQIEFVQDLFEARKEVLTSHWIKKRFKQCGIMPVNAFPALNQLKLFHEKKL